MNVGALFSGGKDSTFALHWASAQGWDIKCLISLESKNPHSYMFHTPNIHLVKEQAKCLDLPIVYKETKGEKEVELQDLKAALQEAKEKYQVDTIITGAVASNYQEERVNRICQELDLRTFSPLWHKDQEQLLIEMLDANFEIKIIAIAAEGLDESYLGKTYDSAMLEDLKQKHTKFGLHIAGEGGEFESLITNAPLFRKRIIIEQASPVMDSKNSGHLDITKASLLDK